MAPGFDFPDQLQRRLGQAPGCGIEPKHRRQAVASLQHFGVRAMGWRVAQAFSERFALIDEAWQSIRAHIEYLR